MKWPCVKTGGKHLFLVHTWVYHNFTSTWPLTPPPIAFSSGSWIVKGWMDTLLEVLKTGWNYCAQKQQSLLPCCGCSGVLYPRSQFLCWCCSVSSSLGWGVKIHPQQSCGFYWIEGTQWYASQCSFDSDPIENLRTRPTESTWSSRQTNTRFSYWPVNVGWCSLPAFTCPCPQWGAWLSGLRLCLCPQVTLLLPGGGTVPGCQTLPLQSPDPFLFPSHAAAWLFCTQDELSPHSSPGVQIVEGQLQTSPAWAAAM